MLILRLWKPQAFLRTITPKSSFLWQISLVTAQCICAVIYFFPKIGPFSFLPNLSVWWHSSGCEVDGGGARILNANTVASSSPTHWPGFRRGVGEPPRFLIQKGFKYILALANSGPIAMGRTRRCWLRSRQTTGGALFSVVSLRGLLGFVNFLARTTCRSFTNPKRLRKAILYQEFFEGILNCFP
jgi:hypothetical protein